MRFEELEHWAATGEQPDKPVAIWDRLYYLELLRLLGRFRAKKISQVEAAAEKTQLRIEWERQKRMGEMDDESADKRRQAIAKSELLRAEISKGISAGKDECELLSLALRCIGEMTGDFWMEEVANKYGKKSGGRKQENISIPHVADDADV